MPRFYTYLIGDGSLMLTADQMLSLPYFFTKIADPRRAQGRRHQLSTVLGIAAGAVLCGARTYVAISDWAEGLGIKARKRFGCRRRNGGMTVPSVSTFRNVLTKMEPSQLDHALQDWNETYGQQDKSLAIDGKTMCNAVDKKGWQPHIMSVIGHQTKNCYTQKKVGTLPPKGDDEAKRTNEIKTAKPLLDAIDIAGKTITADALLTQTALAEYLVKREADYHFTVKGNQPTLLADLTLYFQDRMAPAFVTCDGADHGRVETRKIWVTSELNNYLKFPHVAQAFVIERQRWHKKTGESSTELAYGVTSVSSDRADAEKVLATNREHWCIENSCHHILDTTFDEDHSTIRTGFGPENMTRLRRLAIGLIKSKGVTNVARKTRQLNLNVRNVLDYLRMTQNSCSSKLK
jgi:predicted transposase YbfD/YdcC